MFSAHTAKCAICLETAQDPVNCCEDLHDSFCTECMVEYMKSLVGSAYYGICPVIYCPSTCHPNNKRRVLQYEKWKKLVPYDIASKFTSLAKSLLVFLCGECHEQRTLDVGYHFESSETFQAELEDSFNGTPKMSELLEAIRLYSIGDYVVEEFYDLLISNIFPDLKSETNDTKAWRLFAKVLKVIRDPERRANLHLRYLRDRPRIHTVCCQRQHCFKCRTDFHEGKTCLENVSDLDHTIVHCPVCNISIAKGDGCNILTCVCGHRFSWLTEKENITRCERFLSLYPQNPSSECASILCTGVDFSRISTTMTTINTQTSGIDSAATDSADILLITKAWQVRNRVAVNRELKNWFKQKYSPCPTQACLVLTKPTAPPLLSEGIREALDLWKQDHRLSIDKRRKQNELAFRSIFLGYCTQEKDRPMIAHLLTTYTHHVPNAFDPLLISSAHKWIEDHRGSYSQGLEMMRQTRVQQFLYLFGKKPITSMLPMDYRFPTVREWDIMSTPIQRGSDFMYTNHNLTVERISNSQRNHPPLIAELPSHSCIFQVCLESIPPSSQSITFGIVSKAQFLTAVANASFTGVGRMNHSWGIAEERRLGTNNNTTTMTNVMITENGSQRITRFDYRFTSGDKLLCIVNASGGWIELYVNNSIGVAPISIPIGTAKDYIFVMTIGYRHRVTLLVEPLHDKPYLYASTCVMSSRPKHVHILNSDHTRMYYCMIQYLKTMIKAEEDVSASSISTSSAATANTTLTATTVGLPESMKMLKFIKSQLLTSGDKWLEFCEYDELVAKVMYDDLTHYFDNNILMSGHMMEEISSAESANVVDTMIVEAEEGKAAEATSKQVNNAFNHHNNECLKHITWELFLDAISWYYHNREALQQQEVAKLAFEFVTQHGDDAPFIAAFRAADHHTTPQELKEAHAYMKLFAEEMNIWYEYDAMLEDPMIANVAQHCRCLPRHIGSRCLRPRNSATTTGASTNMGGSSTSGEESTDSNTGPAL